MTTKSNEEQIEYWNEQGGPRWVRYQDLLDRQLEPVGGAAMERAAVEQGLNVLDVGCGCGATTLELGRRVGPNGRAVGLDISAPMLARARERAAKEGLTNATFTEADAQTSDIAGGPYDLVFSRFGVMFFDEPTAAFTNLHNAVAADGRLGFVCWQPVSYNPWMLVPTMAAMQIVTIEPPTDPTAPGPFAFADPDYVRGILTDAGWKDVIFESIKPTLVVGEGTASLEEAVDFLINLGPLGRVLLDADAATRANVVETVTDALVPHYSDGAIRMKGACWIVTANA